MAISKRATERATSGLKRLLPIMEQQKTRDVSEADTVTLVKDLLDEVFGFDKYADLTSEHAIRGTYCDLIIRVGDKPLALIEVKSAGTELKDHHVKQVVDYAANEGVDWVILTNGSVWRLYNVIFSKPIDKRLVKELDLTTIDLKDLEISETLGPFMKEGFEKKVQEQIRDRQQATSRFLLAALLLENPYVLARIRRELRRVVDVLVGEDEILAVLRDEVIKRDTLEGPESQSAIKSVRKAVKQKASVDSEGDDDGNSSSVGSREDQSNSKPSSGATP